MKLEFGGEYFFAPGAEGAVRIERHERKGRILVATKEIAVGEVVLSEAPLARVSLDASDACSRLLEMEGSWESSLRFPAVFYWAALQSLSLSAEELQLMRQLEGKAEVSDAVLWLLGEMNLKVTAEDLERALQIWIFNSLKQEEFLMLPLLMAPSS